MKSTNKTILFLLILLGIVANIKVYSQEVEVTNDSIKQVPVPVNIVDIIKEIREVNNDLKLIKKKAKPSKDLIQIDSIYPSYKEFLSKQEAVSRAFVLSNPNRQKIENQIKKWGVYKEAISKWESKINDYNNKNSALIHDLNSKIKTWNLTYKNANENNAPRELLGYAQGIRDSLYLADKAITRTTTKYLRLQTKFARLGEIVDEIRSELQQFKRSKQYHVLHKRHTNIWNPEDRDFKTNDDGKEALESYETAMVDLYRYVISKPEFLINYVITMVVFFFLLRYFRRAFIKYPLEEKNSRLKRFGTLLTQQSTLILIFAGLAFLRFYIVGNERIFSDVINVAMMLTIIPIVKLYEPKFFRSFFYFLTGMYVLDAFKTYAWFSSLDYRLFLFLEFGLLIVLVLRYSSSYLLQNKRPETRRFSKYFQYLRPAILSGILVGIIANIFGYTNLADIVLIVSIQSGIVSVFAYAILLIVESMAISVVYRHYERPLQKTKKNQLVIEKDVLKYIKIIVVTIWAVLFLGIIDRLEDFIDYLELFLSETYTIGSISFTLGAIFSFFLVLFISYTLSKLVSFFVNEDNEILKVFNFSKGVPTAISVVSRYAIIGFGFIFALSILGIDLSTFNLMAGALGLGIGFGLQTIISNFVSGLILIFERPILPGDSVEFNDLWGTVTKIGIRASVVNTYDGAEVIVPNNNLITNDLINWTHSSKIRRMQINIGTSYSSDPNRVLEILSNAAKKHSAVLKDPEPQVLFMEFGESSLNFSLRYWVYFEDGFASKSDISIAIYNAFKEAQIEIPFPQRDLHIKSITKGENPTTEIGFNPSTDD
ncbi:mechanosensitive ion channel family protein [Winogradskyella aurantiaca]|uniref:mechanosensitive ion channel family protein n=1 Tax=Winogradskyella aurantiaca TaxID=2219558 RepID=UPI000E1D9BCC|nr:mechanosensitive ion channel domain-containing protein [Winogradskyella aurantiaca]